MGERCSGSAVTRKLISLLLWPWTPFVREGGREFRGTLGLGHHRAGWEEASRWNEAVDRRSQCCWTVTQVDFVAGDLWSVLSAMRVANV